MIKWLLIVVVLGVGGYFGYMYMHPEKRACARLVTDLCHHSSSPDEDRKKCEELFQHVRDKAGDEAAASTAKCISDSDNCMGAVGCTAGAAAKVGVGLFGEFVKGAEKAFAGEKSNGEASGASRGASERAVPARTPSTVTARIVFGTAALLVISFSAWMGWYKLHPQDRGCAKSIALCKPPDPVKAAKDCREVLLDIGQRRGGSIERMAANCMVESESCNESLSCLSHADRRANEMGTRSTH